MIYFCTGKNDSGVLGLLSHEEFSKGEIVSTYFPVTFHGHRFCFCPWSSSRPFFLAVLYQNFKTQEFLMDSWHSVETGVFQGLIMIAGSLRITVAVWSKQWFWNGTINLQSDTRCMWERNNSLLSMPLYFLIIISFYVFIFGLLLHSITALPLEGKKNKVKIC